ncbi:hypothetical protein TSUD_133750 [Trifolium subterraneum]|uniref:Uncharacterized protein n=1 Tax=Trifolium subterraneum TaxID=3900 RepID=A0A2Z6PEQ6_TRISU|nr:hypothetical protein TSUD_133750 [Trifolium subterraneum]
MNGTKSRSYIGTESNMESVTKLPRDAAGILKSEPRFLSKVVPCLTKRVLICAQMVLGISVTSHIRSIPKISFAPSTWFTVIGTLLESVVGSSLIAALSKNLNCIHSISG